MNRKQSALAFGLMFLLAGCGGPGRATPTPIPASVARPQQPTPVYPDKADVFSLSTPVASPQFVTDESSAGGVAVEATGSMERAAVSLYIKNQTPSAMGITGSGTAIYAERGGRALATVPVGGVLTVTGKSADGDWYAVYNDDAVFGWVPASQLRVYGADALIVVDQAPDPAPVATLLAQAYQPVRVLDRLMAEMENGGIVQGNALATPVPALVSADNGSTAEAAEVPATGVTGSVVSEGRLNLRTRPNTDGEIVVKLDPGATLAVTGRTIAGDWLRVQASDGAAGWVAAEFLAINQPIEDIPVVAVAE